MQNRNHYYLISYHMHNGKVYTETDTCKRDADGKIVATKRLLVYGDNVVKVIVEKRALN